MFYKPTLSTAFFFDFSPHLRWQDAVVWGVTVRNRRQTPSEIEYFTEVEEVKKLAKKVVTGILAVSMMLSSVGVSYASSQGGNGNNDILATGDHVFSDITILEAGMEKIKQNPLFRHWKDLESYKLSPVELTNVTIISAQLGYDLDPAVIAVLAPQARMAWKGILHYFE